MLNLDDPLLALLLRFVINTDQIPVANEEFLHRQIKTIKWYLTQFPSNEQEAKVIEWIEQHAERYRWEWQRHDISSRSACVRCEDCPLADLCTYEHCEIHEQWLYLLRQYTTGQVNSRSYIESSLELLQNYKDELKLRGARFSNTVQSKEPKKKKKKKKKTKKSKKGKKDK
ncbi:MAG: hypothetical protein ABFS45_20300 [Pseudomonadota bacterium]